MAEPTVEVKKEKLKLWLKNPYNLMLLALIIFALLIRLYYFTLTMHQPLWWDEAEYMLKAKNIAFGTPDTGYAADVRPILFSLIAAVFYKIGAGEIAIRFIWALLSVGGIFLVYCLGRDMFSKRIGIIAAFMMSLFYIDIFYTTRLMVDMPSTFLILLACYFFVQHTFKGKSSKYIWPVLPILFIGVMLRFTVGLFVIILLAFLLVTAKLSLFKKKEWYISIAISIIAFLPYMIYSWVKFGSPIYVITSVIAGSATTRDPGVTGFDIFMQYISYFPSYTSFIFFALFIVGLIIVLFQTSLRFDRLTTDHESKKYIFLIIWIALTLWYFGFFVNHFEDRYIYMIFPTAFLIAAHGVDALYLYLKKYNQYLAVGIIAVIMVWGAYQNFTHFDSLVKGKISSYQDLKDAGTWIMENSNKGDVVISSGVPENTYYSERSTYSYPATAEEFDKQIKDKHPKYMIISLYERVPSWINDWTQKNNQTIEVKRAYFVDEARTQISTIIYQFK